MALSFPLSETKAPKQAVNSCLHILSINNSITKTAASQRQNGDFHEKTETNYIRNNSGSNIGGIMVIVPISASAAGVATRLQTLFEDDYQAKTPEMLTPIRRRRVVLIRTEPPHGMANTAFLTKAQNSAFRRARKCLLCPI